jgi:hypothetical protein
MTVSQTQRDTVWGEQQGDLMHETRRHGQGACTHIARKQPFGLKLHGDPDPVRRAGEACDRLGLAHLTVVNGPAHGIQRLALDLRAGEIAHAIRRKGPPLLRRLDQPLPHRVGIDLEHSKGRHPDNRGTTVLTKGYRSDDRES